MKTAYSSSNSDYTIIMKKIDNNWKILSGTIRVDIDPVDDIFNVNKELGFNEGIIRYKSTSNPTYTL